MLMLYYTHSVLFYLGLPSFQPNNDFKKHLHSFDYDYLPQEVCVAQCLENKQVMEMPETSVLSNQFMKTCMHNCSSVSHTNLTQVDNIPPPIEIRENYTLNLICRDESSLNFKIDLHMPNKNSKLNENQSNSSLAEFNSTQLCLNTNAANNASNEVEENQCQYRTLFVIKNHLANEADKIFVYLSDDNFFTIDKLASNTTYNISVLAVHSTNKYSIVAQHQQFKTLRRSYTPGNVKEIKITHFTEDKLNKMHLTATLTWKPATDRTCHYNIICFSPENEDYDLQPLEIQNPRQLYKHQLENLTFSSMYKVGIRASNTKSMRESELVWKTFTVPSCVQWYNYNFNICAPESPQNLYVEESVIEQNVYSLNITWQLPSHLPDNYTLRIQDLSVQGEASTYKLPKDVNNFFVPKIYFYGMFYEVTLTASTGGGNAKASFSDIIRTVVHVPEKNSLIKLIAIVVVAIFCFAVLPLTICIIYHRRAKLKRYQERCKYFEELEKKAPVEPKNNFDFNMSLLANSSNLINGQNYVQYDDDMEIDINNLILFEVLGEGAFGLVRLGLYTDSKLGVNKQVAVKMLKDHPSVDDICAFRREIEVMKSVEKHPNIVGIIGHSTRFSHQMMLLTEYCSFGNLLNFLREEWHFLHKMRSARERSKENLTYIELKHEYNTSQDLHAENNLVQPTVQHDCIQIGDCDCTMKEKCCNSTNKFNFAVENKSYFLPPSSDHKYLPTKNPNTIDRTKMEYKAQLQPQATLEIDIDKEGADKSNMNVYANDLERDLLTLEDLLHIARQVAVGMEFLAKNKVVHRDLAARNVLVAPDKTIKIADFGLSRDVYQENMYRKTGNGKLPIKWLALESMTHQVYTTQTDVWSYGILLYEIFTLGATPYPSIPTNRLLDFLKSGYRMEKPPGCQPELYNLMYSCWKVVPEARPSFNTIIQKLDEMLRSVGNQNNLPIIYFEVDKDIGRQEEEEEEGNVFFRT